MSTKMEAPVLTQRKLNNQLVNGLISQRCSQTLLLNLIKYAVILYVVLTVLSIPIWVFSAIQFSRYKENNAESTGMFDYILLTTTAHLHHCRFDSQSNQAYQQNKGRCIIKLYQMENVTKLSNNQKQGYSTHKNNKKIDNYPQYNNTNDSSNQGFNDMEISNKTDLEIRTLDYSQSPYLLTSLYYDYALQIILCIGCMILQYNSFKTKQRNKGSHIEDYSLEIYSLPLTQPYIILPKLQQYITSQLRNRFQLVVDDLCIFSTTSAYSNQKYWELILKQQINLRMSQVMNYTNIEQAKGSQKKCKSRLQQIQEKLKKVQTQHASNDTVWITFQSRQARYLALRFLQSSQLKFMNHCLKVRKAPHPLQILWQNLHTPFYEIIISRLISLAVCMGLLLLFDLLILYIHKSPYPIVASLVILVLEIILKQTIINVSNLQKHRYKSKLDLSIFSKLTKYLYINTALIVFISSYDFGDNKFVNTFSSRTFKNVQISWFQHVGLNILLGFIIQVAYVNARPFIQLFKSKLKIKAIYYWKLKHHNLTDQQRIMYQTKNKQIKLDSELDICYAHIISVVMYGNTYSFTHPVFYPLLALFAFLAYFSHRKHIANHSQPAPYNNEDLNYIAIQYIYGSVIMHQIIVFMEYGFIPSLILGIVLACVLLTKNTLIRIISQNCRKKFGPFCFSKFQKVHPSTKSLLKLLTPQQKNTHIMNLHQKIKMYTYIYNSLHETQSYANKACLQRYIKVLQQNILKFQNYRQNQVKQTKLTHQNFQYQNSERLRNVFKEQKQSKCTKKQIKGKISYILTEDMLDS